MGGDWYSGRRCPVTPISGEVGYEDMVSVGLERGMRA